MIQFRQTDTTYISVQLPSTCVFKTTRAGSAGGRERESPVSRGQAGGQAEGKLVDVFKSLLI